MHFSLSLIASLVGTVAIASTPASAGFLSGTSTPLSSSPSSTSSFLSSHPITAKRCVAVPDALWKKCAQSCLGTKTLGRHVNPRSVCHYPGMGRSRAILACRAFKPETPGSGASANDNQNNKINKNKKPIDDLHEDDRGQKDLHSEGFPWFDNSMFGIQGFISDVTSWVDKRSRNNRREYNITEMGWRSRDPSDARSTLQIQYHLYRKGNAWVVLVEKAGPFTEMNLNEYVELKPLKDMGSPVTTNVWDWSRYGQIEQMTNRYVKSSNAALRNHRQVIEPNARRLIREFAKDPSRKIIIAAISETNAVRDATALLAAELTIQDELYAEEQGRVLKAPRVYPYILRTSGKYRTQTTKTVYGSESKSICLYGSTWANPKYVLPGKPRFVFEADFLIPENSREWTKWRKERMNREATTSSSTDNPAIKPIDKNDMEAARQFWAMEAGAEQAYQAPDFFGADMPSDSADSPTDGGVLEGNNGIEIPSYIMDIFNVKLFEDEKDVEPLLNIHFTCDNPDERAIEQQRRIREQEEN